MATKIIVVIFQSASHQMQTNSLTTIDNGEIKKDRIIMGCTFGVTIFNVTFSRGISMFSDKPAHRSSYIFNLKTMSIPLSL